MFITDITIVAVIFFYFLEKVGHEILFIYLINLI